MKKLLALLAFLSALIAPGVASATSPNVHASVFNTYSTGTTCTPGAVSAFNGDILVIAIHSFKVGGGEVTTSTVTVSGLTFTRVKQYTYGASSDNDFEVWVSNRYIGSTTTFSPTATMSGTITGMVGCVVTSISNANGIQALDPNVSLPASANVATGYPTASMSTTNPDDLLIGFSACNTSTCGWNTTTGNPPTGWTYAAGTGSCSASNCSTVEEASLSVSAAQTNTSVTWGGSGNTSSEIGMILFAATWDNPATPLAPTVDGTNGSICSTTATCTVSLTTTNASDLIVVYSYNEKSTGASTVSSVTATGLTFTKRAQQQYDSNKQDMEVWSAQASATLSAATITVTLNAATDDGTVLAFGVKGANSVAPFDPNGALPVSGSVTNPNSTGLSLTVNTTQPDDMLIEIVGCDQTSTNCYGSGAGTFPSGYSGTGAVPPTCLGNWTTLGSVYNGGGSLYASVAGAIQSVSGAQSSLSCLTIAAGSPAANTYYAGSMILAVTADASSVIRSGVTTTGAGL